MWRYRQLQPLVLGVASFVVLGLLWELSARQGWVNPFLTSQPTAIAKVLQQQIASGRLWRHLLVSLNEFAIGFGGAVLVGVLLGLLTGWYRRVEYALDPFIWFLYSAPLISLYPLFIIYLGLGKPSVIAITFLFSVTPVLVNTATGIKNLDPRLVQAARSFGAGDAALFFKIALPASVPMVMAGLRLGIGRALLGVVVSEMFGGNAGLGFSITYHGSRMQIPSAYAFLIIVVILGVLLTQGLAALEARVDSWRTGPQR